MRLSRDSVGGYKMVPVSELLKYNFMSLFTKEDVEIMILLQNYLCWQTGEGPLPKGMDAKQCKILLESEKSKQLAARAEDWYQKNGGTVDAICGPFLVHGKSA